MRVDEEKMVYNINIESLPNNYRNMLIKLKNYL